MSGFLYIVATPIGNLQDITLRAIEILKTVDVIAAEDTRHSQSLLKHLGIQKKLISLHDFNEKDRSEILIKELISGKNIALISDAGTPLISDPGYVFVKKAYENSIRVIPIPGACAAIAALSVAGLPTDRFLFVGFLPHQNAARKKILTELKEETATLVFYEAPHRLLLLFENIIDVLGSERLITLAREMTKTYETIYHGLSIDVQAQMIQNPAQLRGECVLLVQGAAKKDAISDQKITEAKKILHLLMDQLPTKQSIQLTQAITNITKNEIYRWALDYDKSK